MTLTEFLLARIAEDEAAARDIPAGSWEDACSTTRRYDHVFRWSPARVLAECEAKRRMVERFAWAAEDPDLYRSDMELMDQWEAAMDTLTDAAAIYADHPDYNPDWKS